MRRGFLMVMAALAFAGAAIIGMAIWPIGKNVEISQLKGNAERGAYLARLSGCIACHTNSAGSGSPLAGGVQLKTEFGVFYSPNLTSSVEHGIGGWTVNDFAKAIRQGISPKGEPYYPAFPYLFYAKFSDQEVADLWAAFQTVPSAAVPSKPQDLAVPFNFRSGLKLWRWLFQETGKFVPAVEAEELWSRGKFLVEGPAHCGACHTPRNWFGARDPGRKFQGSGGLPDGGKSPPITATDLKRRGWTVAKLRYALRTGIMPEGDVFGGAMGEVVREGTAFASERDLLAIATFLMEEN